MHDNRKTWLLIFFAAAGIILLTALAFFTGRKQGQIARAHKDNSSRAEGIYEVLREAQTETAGSITALAMLSGAGIQETQAPVTEDLPEDPEYTSVLTDDAASYDHRILFVGDSRTVGMKNALSDRVDHCITIAASGEGYEWFERSALGRIRRTLKRFPHLPVVFNLGVNDTESIDNYIRAYRSLMEEYPRLDFWFLSVNPVTEDSILVPDQDVEAFNRILKEAFPDRYLDCYTWLKKNNFECVDGVHYSEDTYLDIHDYTVKELKKYYENDSGKTNHR